MIGYYVRGFVNLLFIPETRFFIVEIQALDNSGDWETAKSTAFFTGSVFEEWTDWKLLPGRGSDCQQLGSSAALWFFYFHSSFCEVERKYLELFMLHYFLDGYAAAFKLSFLRTIL